MGELPRHHQGQKSSHYLAVVHITPLSKYGSQSEWQSSKPISLKWSKWSGNMQYKCDVILCEINVFYLLVRVENANTGWKTLYQTFTQSRYSIERDWKDRKGRHIFNNLSSFITAARFPVSPWINPQTSSPHTNWSASCHGNRSGSGSDIFGQTFNVIPLCCSLSKQPINGHPAGAVCFDTSLRTVSFIPSLSGTELHFVFVLP